MESMDHSLSREGHAPPCEDNPAQDANRSLFDSLVRPGVDQAMSKKYLTLEEAASLLSLPVEELRRLRERGEIRGFADRGTWKFKQEDVESLQRKRQADSNPEVPLFDDSNADMNLLADDDADPEFLSDSDSDVRLVGEPEIPIGLDSDSDVKLVGLGQTLNERLGAGTDPEIPLLDDGSDSDVKLIRPDSDSDVKLPGEDSDSDVKLVGGATESKTQMVSDSDINLIPDKTSGEVTMVPGRGSVLDEDSGISLAADSSLMLGAESGINLEGPADSGIALDEPEDDEGITLALEGDSGISLDIGDSGISLESVGESGISLEDDSVGGGTIPMMDVLSDDKVPETQFEMASLEDDSNFELGNSDDATGVLATQSSAELDDAAFDLDDDAGEEMIEDDVDLDVGGFEEEENLDVFDADDDAFSGADSQGGFAASGARPMVAQEQEWGTFTFVGLALSCLLMLGVGAVMLDLVKNIATASVPNVASSSLIDMLRGLVQ